MGKSFDKSYAEALLKRIESLELEVARLKSENASFRAVISTLRAENEHLKLELAAARKNSRNSSKPPSSDIVKPPPTGKKGKRRIGAQPGHQPHFRVPFTPEQLDDVHVFEPPSMTCACGGTLRPCPVSDLVQQQIELRDNPILRREYRAPAYRCSRCGAFHRAKLPQRVIREGFVGDRLATALVFLNAKAHASYSALAAFMKDVCRVPISRGLLAKTFSRVSNSLEAPYVEARESLRHEPVLNIDETGHREKGKRFWTWVFSAAAFVVFHIDKTRSAKVLSDVLGPEYSGTIGCDYYSAYHSYLATTGGTAQFCHAHLVRDLRFLRSHPDPETRKYAARALAAEKSLFRVHNHLRGHPDADRRELAKAGERLWRTIVRAPPEKKAQNIARRFLDVSDSYLSFIANPLVEPTNNSAEQAIRHGVIDRAATQGTRSPTGRTYRERIWTVIATCARKSTSPFSFVLDALRARTDNTTPPSLLNL